MARCRLHDPLSGPADNRMAAYLAGSHHPNQAKRPRSAYIAVSGEAVVGYIAGHLTRRFDCDAEVQYLFVAPAHRRHRVATALLRLLSMWFVEQGAEPVSPGPGELQKFIAAETAKWKAIIQKAGEAGKRAALEDLFWSVLSSKEFLFNH